MTQQEQEKHFEEITNKMKQILFKIGNTVLAAVPYQLCPKCNGQGQVSKPPYIAGDVHQWSNSSCVFPCDVCNGSKIIQMFIVSQDAVKA